MTEKFRHFILCQDQGIITYRKHATTTGVLLFGSAIVAKPKMTSEEPYLSFMIFLEFSYD